MAYNETPTLNGEIMEPTNIEPTRVNRFWNFVERHKVAIAVTATSAAWYGINRIALKQHDDFLKEHDLYEEFYTPSDEEMGL